MHFSRRQLLFSAAALSAPLPIKAAAVAVPAAVRVRSEFWEPHDRDLIGMVDLRQDSRVIDVGCGYGDHVLLLAERVTKGRVVAFDRDAKRLEIAAGRAKMRGSDKRIEFIAGDLFEPKIEQGSFDLVWSSHVVHGLSEIDKAIESMAGLLKPVGQLVLRENRLANSLLPRDTGGVAPGLEARLQGAFESWFLDDRVKLGRYPHGWLAALERNGLQRVTARSLLFERLTPFSPVDQEYLTGWLRRFLEYSDLASDDRRYVEAMLDAKSEEHLFRRKDLHFLAVSTLYMGRKA